MGSSIIVIRSGDRIITSLYEDKEMITVRSDKTEAKAAVGNIYLGKVRNIVKNINAAFVEISGKEICYLSLNENPDPIFADLKKHPIRVGDEVIVQIAKDATKTKALNGTTNISLTGRYAVLVKGKNTVGVSSKIADEAERNRLKELIKPYTEEDYGFIVRTNAAFVPEEELIAEVKKLKEEYYSITKNGIHRTCYSLLFSAPPQYISEIRDGYSSEIESIKTDDREIYEEIKRYLETCPKDELAKLEFYEDDSISLSTLYGIESKLQKALFERSWLSSGAYLIIQPTEALVSIDVNTGKAITGKEDTEETFLKVNLEAAEEIGRQLRLRNLSGIIIVDFIDMKKEEHKNLLLKKLREVLSKDHIPAKLVDMTALNLVEITRQRIHRPLYEQIK
jgi:ribonuclease G